MAFLKKRHVAVLWFSCLTIPGTITFCAWTLLVNTEPTPMPVELKGDSSKEKISILEDSLEYTHEQLNESRETIVHNKSQFDQYVNRSAKAITEANNSFNKLIEQDQEIKKLKRQLIKKENALRIEKSKPKYLQAPIINEEKEEE